jgi:GAF domain-containing protein
MSREKHNTHGDSVANSTSEFRLGAARKRLAQSNGQEDAIDGLREIVGTFLGSEELGLFRVDRSTSNFRVFWSFGIDLKEYDLLAALGDAGLQRVMRGEHHVEVSAREHSGASPKAQAFIPIRFANQTVAILAILRLLPQKLAFDGHDIELFQLLADEAAAPLFGQNMFGESVSGPNVSGPNASGRDTASKPATGEPGMNA